MELIISAKYFGLFLVFFLFSHFPSSSSSSSLFSSSLSSSSLSSSSISSSSYHELSHLPHTNCSGSVGGETILSCKVEFPGDGKWIPYTFKWTKLGAKKPLFFRFPGYPPHLEAPYLDRVKMTNPANVRMWDLTREDEGWYHCLITYMNRVPEDMPSPNGTWVFLSILSPPRLLETSPSTIILKEGGTLALKCQAEGKPSPEMFWYRDGFPLATDARVSLDGGALLIYHVTRKDAGVYVCRAENSVGDATHSIKVVLQGGVFIMTPPMNTTVKEGQRVQLSCGAEARPANITYRWSTREMDIPVGSVEGLSARATLLPDGALVLSSAFGSDTGWFFCSASNGLSSATAKAFLNVTYPPKILPGAAKILYLPKADPGAIPCRAEANPPVSHVNWVKDGEALRAPRVEAKHGPLTAHVVAGGHSSSASSSHRRQWRHRRPPDFTFLDNGLSLALSAAAARHEGVYSCTPFNSLGAGPTSKPVRVLVRDPPRFVVRPREYEQRMLKDSVTFHCDAEGDPTPSIVWRKAGSPGGGLDDAIGATPSFSSSSDSLPRDRAVLRRGNLTVSNLRRRDAGRFECLATNVVTTVVAGTRLIIETTTPHAPYNITVTTRRFSARVAWLPAFNSGLELQYVLWFKRLGRDKVDWRTVSIRPNDATSFGVDDLLPDAIYEFSVQAKTRSGDAMFSKVIRIRTKSLDDANHTDSSSDVPRKTLINGGDSPLVDDRFLDPHHPRYPPPTPLATLPRPSAPRRLRVSAVDLHNAVNVSFASSALYGNSSVAADFYLLQYRSKDSIGWQEGRPRLWTTVSDRLPPRRRWVVVKQLRPGYKYDFRAFALSRYKAFSHPSPVVTYVSPSAPAGHGSGPGLVVSTAAVAGLAGGLAFLIATVALSALAVRVVHKQAFDERSDARAEKKKFCAVKYTDARNTNGHCKMTAYNRSAPGGRAHV